MGRDAAVTIELTPGALVVGRRCGGRCRRRKYGVAALDASRNPSMHRGSSRVMDVDLQPNAEAIRPRRVLYRVVTVGRFLNRSMS